MMLITSYFVIIPQTEVDPLKSFVDSPLDVKDLILLEGKETKTHTEFLIYTVV